MTELERIEEAFYELVNNPPEEVERGVVEDYKFRMLTLNTYMTCPPTIFIKLESGEEILMSYYTSTLFVNTYANSQSGVALEKCKVPRPMSEEQFFQYSLVVDFGILSYEVFKLGEQFCDHQARKSAAEFA